MRLIIFGIICFAILDVHAQDKHDWELYLEQVMTVEDASSETWQQTYDMLCNLEQHPLNINMATREELEALPFLSDQQVEELVEYLYRYGPMKSTAELMMMKRLTPAQRKLLTCFIVIGDKKTKSYIHHELTTTAKVPLSDGHWFRYQLQYGDKLRVGLVGDQDADEPFFEGRNKWGYDYYSPYLQLTNLGRVEQLVLGNFRMSMGMGLVMNNSFALGKISMMQNLGRSTNTLRAHSSRSEGYLQGGAATINLGRGFHISSFVSYAPMDATLNADGTARTILTSGYHRTETEMSKKHNTHALKTGGSLRYHAHRLHLGLNGLFVHLDRPLHPNSKQLYNMYKPQGEDFVNISLDYGYANRHWSLNGETAVDAQGHIATINSLSLAMNNGLTLMALQRFYSYRYTSLDAQSYSDGGTVQNESGVYVGASWQPSPHWQLTAYTDYAYFPWPRYRQKGATWSMDHLIQCVHTHGNWKWSARYRLKSKQKEHRTRLSATYDANDVLSMKTQFDGVYSSDEKVGCGGMLSENIAYKYRWLRLNAGVGYYYTDTYYSRVYQYENGPLYTYSMQQLYGDGIRYWMMLRANAGRHLMLTAKLGVNNSFDRPSKTDISIQMRLKI